jgi:hypothetical protein
MKAVIEDARRVKSAAGRAAGKSARVVGVGLTKIGDSYAVKVNLAEPPRAEALLPDLIDGVPIVYEVVGQIMKHAAG